VQFGELGMIYSTLGMFGVLAGFGLGTTATKNIARVPERRIPNGPAASWDSLRWWPGFQPNHRSTDRLSGAVVVAHGLERTPSGGALRIGTTLLFFNAVNGAQTGALSGFEAFRNRGTSNLIRGAITFPLVVGGVWLADLNGAVAGLSLAAAAGAR